MVDENGVVTAATKSKVARSRKLGCFGRNFYARRIVIHIVREVVYHFRKAQYNSKENKDKRRLELKRQCERRICGRACNELTKQVEYYDALYHIFNFKGPFRMS